MFESVVFVLNFSLDEREELLIVIISLSDWWIRFFQIFSTLLRSIAAVTWHVVRRLSIRIERIELVRNHH